MELTFFIKHKKFFYLKNIKFLSNELIINGILTFVKLVNVKGDIAKKKT